MNRWKKYAAIAVVFAMGAMGLRMTAKQHAAETYRKRGAVCFAAGEYKKALAEYGKAIQSNPENAAAYAGRARVRYMVEERELALADAEQAIALDARCASAYEMRAYARAAQEDYEGAMDDVNRAMALEPKDARWHIVRAGLYGEQGNREQFHADWDKGARVGGAVAKLREMEALGHGVIRFWQSDAEVAAHCARILEANPKAEKALFWRGRWHREREEYEEAIADFSGVLESAPSRSDACMERAYCWHCLGREEEAAADIARAKALEAQERAKEETKKKPSFLPLQIFPDRPRHDV